MGLTQEKWKIAAGPPSRAVAAAVALSGSSSKRRTAVLRTRTSYPVKRDRLCDCTARLFSYSWVGMVHFISTLCRLTRRLPVYGMSVTYRLDLKKMTRTRVCDHGFWSPRYCWPALPLQLMAQSYWALSCIYMRRLTNRDLPILRCGTAILRCRDPRSRRCSCRSMHMITLQIFRSVRSGVGARAGLG